MEFRDNTISARKQKYRNISHHLQHFSIINLKLYPHSEILSICGHTIDQSTVEMWVKQSLHCMFSTRRKFSDHPRIQETNLCVPQSFHHAGDKWMLYVRFNKLLWSPEPTSNIANFHFRRECIRRTDRGTKSALWFKWELLDVIIYLISKCFEIVYDEFHVGNVWVAYADTLRELT